MPRQTFIAREGMPFVGIAVFATLVLFLVGLPLGAALMACVAAFVTYFFRNPERAVPQGAGLVVSPADGRVLSVEGGARAPYTGAPSTRVSIFMSVMNVHINRFPVAASVKRAVYHPGKFFVASLDKASEHNERSGLVLADEGGREFVVVQIAGIVARRIISYVREGDSLGRGERFGLIRFGSRVDLYMPPEYAPQVRAGDRLKGGESVVGRLP